MIKRVFKAFQYRDFRLMWIGACTSSIGTWMQSLAQSWLVYDLTKDAFYSGLDSFLGQIPIMLLSLIGGVITDRHDRRHVLLASQYIQMTCAFILTGLVYTHYLTGPRVWFVLALSFTVGVAQAFGGPANQALLPSLVGKEDYANAISWNSIQFNIARSLGPLLGSYTMAALGAAWCFGLNGASFLAVILSLSLIRVNYVPSKSREPILDSMKEGIRFIREKQGMESLIVLAFFITALAMPLTVFLPVMTDKVFHAGAEVQARLMACSAGGSVVGALTAAGIGKLKRQGRGALLALTLLGLLIAAFGYSTNLWVSYGLVFCVGASMMAVFSQVSSLAQSVATDQMRGRVMSVFNVAFRGGGPVGSFIVGWVISQFHVGVGPTLSVVGLLLAAIALFNLTIHRKVAEL